MKFQKNRIACFQAQDLLKNFESFHEMSQETERKLPTEFLLLHFGKIFFTRNGQEGEFEFTQRDASVVLADFKRRAKDLVIDYEHQSLSGNKAPAAGWIDGLTLTAEGLTAHVKYWTEEASAMLLKGEYRYFSPTLYFSRSGKNISAIHSVALTNHPAMHGIPALVADDTDSAVVINNICKNINNQKLQEESTMESPDTEGQALSSNPSNEELTGNITLKEIAEELQELHQCMDQLLERFTGKDNIPETATVQNNHFHTQNLVNQAFDDGKLAECHRQWAYHFADTQPEAFEAWLKDAPRIVPDNQNLIQAVPKLEAASSFTDEQLKIFAMLGTQPESMQDATKHTL